MKLNERSVVQYATCGTPPDKSGFLMKKSERSGAFQRRWCVLKANLLFFFEERGRREPLGLVVLEGCTVELCEGERVDFAFAVRFGLGHAHTLAADTQRDMEEWAKALARASFQYLRLVVRELERQLEEAQKDRSGIRPSRSTPALRSSEEPDKENGVAWNRPAVPQRTSSETPREKEPGPAAPPHGMPLPKENGVSWNKPSPPANGVAWEGERGAGEHAARPPPVPPRRRSPPEVGVSEVSPGTTRFSKLHDWYGKEVDKVRTEWLQSQ